MNSRFTTWSTTVASIVKVDGGVGGGGGGAAPTTHVCETAWASPGADSTTSEPTPHGFV
jgi:hypothetical protein